MKKLIEAIETQADLLTSESFGPESTEYSDDYNEGFRIGVESLRAEVVAAIRSADVVGRAGVVGALRKMAVAGCDHGFACSPAFADLADAIAKESAGASVSKEIETEER